MFLLLVIVLLKMNSQFKIKISLNIISSQLLSIFIQESIPQITFYKVLRLKSSNLKRSCLIFSNKDELLNLAVPLNQRIHRGNILNIYLSWQSHLILKLVTYIPVVYLGDKDLISSELPKEYSRSCEI